MRKFIKTTFLFLFISIFSNLIIIKAAPAPSVFCSSQVAEDGTAFRFIGAVDNVSYLDIDSVGFTLTYNGIERDLSCTTIYDSIGAIDTTFSSYDSGHTYHFAYTVTSIPVEINVTVQAYVNVGINTYESATGTVDNSGLRAIVANHLTISLVDIPAAVIDRTKANANGAYWHTSHGRQITTGLGLVEDLLGSEYRYAESGTNCLIYDDIYGTDLGTLNAVASSTTSYLNANPDINFVMWSWCGQVSSASEAGINDYLSTMSALEELYPNVNFIYMTGHTDGSGESGNLNIRNNQIREYCIANNKILFDFADIESYDPDGNYYLDKGVSDDCSYDSDGNYSNESNWAIDWQNAHTENVDWCGSEANHTQPINMIMKGYAFWWLMAKLYGSDGLS